MNTTLSSLVGSLFAVTVMLTLGGCAPQQDPTTDSAEEGPVADRTAEELDENSQAVCSSSSPYNPQYYTSLSTCYYLKESDSIDSSYNSDSCAPYWRLRGYSAGGSAIRATATWSGSRPATKFECDNALISADVYGRVSSTTPWVYLNNAIAFGTWTGTECLMGATNYDTPTGYNEIQINALAAFWNNGAYHAVKVFLYKYCSSALGAEAELGADGDAELVQEVPNSDALPSQLGWFDTRCHRLAPPRKGRGEESAGSVASGPP